MKKTKQILINALLAIAAFLATILSRNYLAAQEGMIKYRQIWNVHAFLGDQTAPGILSFLYYKNDRSLYVYNRTADILSAEPEKTAIPREHNNVGIEQTDPQGNMFYKDFSRNALMIRQLVFGEAFIAEEPLPLFEWITVPEEKKIGRFHCKKAFTKFRGRNYEAWYTPEIPVRNGPWKFSGLPGLILEVYDGNREIWFLAESVTTPYNTEKDLLMPSNGQKVSLEVFRSIEFRKGQQLLDSLKSVFGVHDHNEMRFEYFPVEKSYEHPFSTKPEAL